MLNDSGMETGCAEERYINSFFKTVGWNLEGRKDVEYVTYEPWLGWHFESGNENFLFPDS